MRRVWLLLIILLLAACGKRGPLVPPDSFAPAPIGNLSVAQKGSSLELSWSAPGKEEGGASLPLRDLAGFVLLRHVVLPPEEDCDECLNAYSELRQVDLEYLREVRQIGGLYLTDDPYVKAGETYQYKAVALKRDGSRSKDSNKVRKKFVPPPPAPTLRAVPSSTGIDLTMATAAPDLPGFLGFNIYRWKKGEPEPVKPHNATPLKEATFRDEILIPGITYRYKVRTAALVEGEKVESSASNEVEASLIPPD